jgi:predicted ferric reductase
MDKDKSGLSIVKVARENHNTTSIFFTGPEIERFRDRKAGQFASIRVLRDGKWSEPHPFTLSSAPEDATLRMTIKDSGAFTSKIPDLQPGTPIQCAGPFGTFCAGIDKHPEIVMIAGGVGVTPFLSVLRHFRDTRAQNNVLLFWANKTPGDAFAAAELEELTKFLRLTVVHAFSRVPEGERTPGPAFDDGRPGRVFHEFGRLSQEILSRHLTAVNAAFYLCGPPPMQEAVIAELAKCGVAGQDVQKEAFLYNSSKKP